MRILVAGGSGAVGKRLVPLLVAAGHHVTATTRTPEKVGRLHGLGAEVVVMDGLDEESVRKAVIGARPEVIVHEMTALASMGNLRRFDHEFALTNRLRTEGTKHLLAAGQTAGAGRFIAQSYAGWTTGRDGSRVKTEDDPFDPDPPRAMARTLEAIRALERMVLSAPGLVGIVLRYGSLYGPGTSLAEGALMVEMIRRRRLPVIGSGTGVWSFIHVDDAARATQLAIENGASGAYNIVDDEPAEAREWLPGLARAIGARPPRHVPAWVGRLAVGTAGVSMMTRVRGCSNAKAKGTLGWQPAYPTWREGFRRGLSEEPAEDGDEEGHPVRRAAERMGAFPNDASPH
jgi:nucleoside-diphosphate-sugar epimerase